MAEVFDRLKATLSDRYTIERELGAGGMATVYLAHDVKHDRKVAVKVLRPELAESLGTERFLQEIKIAAKLNHPHILPLLDSGTVEEQPTAVPPFSRSAFLYYVMPFVEGESLRDRISREGQLPLEDALQITRDVAAALGYAHSHGVIHRDIKPENILLSGGEAVVADFGIARALSEAGSERLTDTGLAIGTPAYMSPEQASGEQNLDGRSDIYSVGCVLYEMLAGDTPFTASTPQAIIAKKLAEPTPRIRVIRDAVPSAIEATLIKALVKNPADRFVTAQQFIDALEKPGDQITPAGKTEVVTTGPAKTRAWRWPVGIAGVVAIAVVGALLFNSGWPGAEVTSGSEEIERLVVIPFENRTGDSEAADWGLMAAEFITRSIDRASVVTVVPARIVQDLVRAVDPTKGIPLDELAGRTGARYAVAGGYSTAGGNLRFNWELVDAQSGELLAAPDPVVGTIDSLEPVFTLLADRVTAATVALLNPSSEPWAGLRTSPPSMEVARIQLATGDLFCRSQWQEVIEQAKPALEAYPDYGPLLQRMLFAYGNLGRFREWDSVYAVLVPLMDQLTTTERLWVEWAHGVYTGDRTEATRAAEQLYRIQPGMAGYHAGLTASQTNRFADAIERFLAHDLEAPCFRLWVPWWMMLARTYHVLGRYEEELELARRGREQFPQYWPLINKEVVALAGLGRSDAVDSLLDVIADLPQQPAYVGGQHLAFIALELKALGQRDAYETTMDRSLTWFAARPASELRYQRGMAFYYAERWFDADTLFASLVADVPENVDYKGHRGVSAAHLGNRAEATAIDTWLQSQDSKFLLGAHTRWRAAIATALGDRAGAVQLLQQAFEEGMPLGWGHNRDPEWETLRDIQAYREFVRARE